MRTKGDLNSKLHVLADAKGRPIRMFLSAVQTSDYIGARALLSSIPKAEDLLGDRGHDADWFRNALSDRQKDFAVHTISCRLQSPDLARCRPLLPAPQGRGHVRPSQGLAADRNAL